jgi:hypothetical protein
MARLNVGEEGLTRRPVERTTERTLVRDRVRETEQRRQTDDTSSGGRPGFDVDYKAPGACRNGSELR